MATSDLENNCAKVTPAQTDTVEFDGDTVHLPVDEDTLKRTISSAVSGNAPAAKKLGFTVLLTYFSCTVLSLLICFLLGGYPLLVPWLYAALYVFFYFVRLYNYVKVRFGLFMIDPCYWTNFALVGIIIFAPESPKFFQCVFGFIHGPLIWAIATFNAKYYPTSLDRFISLFIHIVPGVVCYVMMWHQPPSTDLEEYLMMDRTWLTCSDSSCPVDLEALYLWPMVFVLAHTILTGPLQVVPEAFGCGVQMSSYKWMTRNDEQLAMKLTNGRCQGVARVISIIAISSFASTLMILPVPLVFKYQYIHAAYLLLFFFLALWNGGLALEKDAQRNQQQKAQLAELNGKLRK